MISVAIDGPSGAGKSTLSKKLAEELGYIYVDTGALYRTIGLAVQRKGMSTKSREETAGLLPEIELSLRHIDGVQRVFLGSEDVSDAIRAEEVGMAASDVSAYPEVRGFLLETQRRLAETQNVIMDGRDIGTVVLPNATVKIFLTADVDDRAMRRYKQLLEGGRQAELHRVKEDVVQRDHNDSNRAEAPLKQAQDALLVDTTGMDFQQAFELLLETIKGKTGKQGAKA